MPRKKKELPVEDMPEVHVAPVPKLTEEGAEITDPVPMELPVKLRTTPDAIVDIKRLVRDEVSRLAEANGLESFDEADDFDVGDDEEISSPYQLDDEQVNYDIRADPRYAQRAGHADEGGGESGGSVQQSGEETPRNPAGESPSQPKTGGGVPE